MAAVLIVGMMFLVSADVIGRKLAKPISGAFELTEFLAVCVIFLGFAYVQQQKGHIRVELFLDYVKNPGYKKALEILNLVVVIAVLGILFWYSLNKTWHLYREHEYAMGLIQFQLWPAYAFIPLGAFIFGLQVIFDIPYLLLHKSSSTEA